MKTATFHSCNVQIGWKDSKQSIPSLAQVRAKKASISEAEPAADGEEAKDAEKEEAAVWSFNQTKAFACCFSYVFIVLTKYQL